MNKSRKTSNIYNIVTYDDDGNVVLPASLSLGVAPASDDNSLKVSTTSWIRAYISSLSLASSSSVTTAIANLVDAAPTTLDTLNELAAALGDDPNFATTISTSIGTRVPQTRTLTINGTAFDLSADRSWTIAAGLTSFNTRTGAITLTSGDVTGALGFTPYNSTNPNNYITGITSSMVTTALGYTPYNSSNPSGYLTAITSSQVTTALGFTPYNATNPSGYITGITSGMVTTALGFTPYNSTNPSGYITGITSANVTTALGYTPYNSTNPSGYITSAALSPYLLRAGGTMSGTITLASISGTDQTVENTFGAYLHLGDWGVGRTATGAVLVNTAYRADFATDLFDMNISRFTNNSGYITSSGTTTGNVASRGLSNWNDLTVIGNVVGMLAWKNYGNNHVIFDASQGTAPNGAAISNTNPNAANWTGTYPTLMGWNGSGTYGVRVDTSRYAESAGSVAWTAVAAGIRQDYDLQFRPADNSGSYAGLSFATPGNSQNAGYILVRGGADNDVYTQNGITIVADTGWLTLAQRTTASRGVRIMSGPSSSTERARFLSDGTIQFVNGAGFTYNGNVILHAGNYNSYSPTLTGGGASGTWSINVSGSASTANQATSLPTLYAGGQQTNPQVYFNQSTGLKVAMTGAWSVWSDTLWINGYAGGDVLQMCALHTLRNGTPRMAISVQASTSSSYGTFYEFITTYNIANQTVGNTTSISSATGNNYNWTGLNYFVSNRNTSTDSAPLQAYSNNGSGAIMSFHRGGYYAVNFGLDSDNVMRIGGWSAGVNRWQLDMSGNMYSAGDITAYSSDRRLKENIITISNPIDKLLRLRGVYYDWKDGLDALGFFPKQKHDIGVIAQELEEVVPEAIKSAPFDTGLHGQSISGQNYKTVQMEKIIPILIEAAKEQQSKIEAQSAQITELMEIIKTMKGL